MLTLRNSSIAIAAAAFGFAGVAHSDVKLGDDTVLSDSPSFIVTYIEVVPSAADDAVSLIKDHSAASSAKDGNVRFEGLRRIGRDNHFVILEAWDDPAARDAHAKSDETTAFRNALQPHLYNPYDERPHAGLVASDPSSYGGASEGSVFAVTHVDIIPPEQFAPCKRQVDENGPCGNDLVKQLVEAGRGAAGNVRFDALTQANRPNHMTIVEMWDSSADQLAHTGSDAVKNFRDTLSGIAPGSGVADDPLFVLNPLTGSLYDERLYAIIE